MKQKNHIAVLGFMRTPFFKGLPKEPGFVIKQLQSCMLSLFEKRPEAVEALGEVSLTSSTIEGLPLVNLQDLTLPFSLDSSVSKFQFQGLAPGSESLYGSLCELREKKGPPLLTGAFEGKQKSLGKVSLSRKHQKLKKQDPLTAYLSEQSFLELLNLEQASLYEEICYDEGFTQEALDSYACRSYSQFEECFNKTLFVSPVVFHSPFAVLRGDMFVNKPHSFAKTKKQDPLLSQMTSPLTSFNTSYVVDGAGFLMLSSVEEVEKKQSQGDSFILDFEFAITRDLSERIKTFLERNSLTVEAVRFFEVSESSSAGSLRLLKSLGNPDLERVNPFGGSLSYGLCPSVEPFHMIGKLSQALFLRGGGYGLALIEEVPGKVLMVLMQSPGALSKKESCHV